MEKIDMSLDDIIKLNKKNKTKQTSFSKNKVRWFRGGGVPANRTEGRTQQRGNLRGNQRQIVAQQAQQRRTKRVQYAQKTARSNIVAQKRQLTQTIRGQGRPQSGRGQGRAQSGRGQGRLQSVRGQGPQQSARGRGQNARGRGQNARGRGQNGRGRGQNGRGRGQNAQGRGQNAQGRGQSAHGQGHGQSSQGQRGRRPLKRSYGTMHSDLITDGATTVKRGWSAAHSVRTSMTICVPTGLPNKDVQIVMNKRNAPGRGQGRLQQGPGGFSNADVQLHDQGRGRARGQARGRGRGQARGRGRGQSRGRGQQQEGPPNLQVTAVNGFQHGAFIETPSAPLLPALNIELGQLPSSSMSLNDRFSSMTSSRSQDSGRIVYV